MSLDDEITIELFKLDKLRKELVSATANYLEAQERIRALLIKTQELLKD